MKTQKVAVISGGSKGLGEAMIRHLLTCDYRIATFSRNESEFIKQMTKGKYKNNFYWEPLDTADFDALNKFIEHVIERYGEINTLINNVGISVEGIITTTSPQKISNLLKVNLESVIRLSQLCIKKMLITQSGEIINISSIVGIRGHAGQAVYSASKAGLDALTRSLARELGPRGIRVNSIAPGYLETDMTSQLSEKQLQTIIARTPLRRLGQVEDIVNVVNFLLSPAASFITGQIIIVDGGLTS